MRVGPSFRDRSVGGANPAACPAGHSGIPAGVSVLATWEPHGIVAVPLQSGAVRSGCPCPSAPWHQVAGPPSQYRQAESSGNQSRLVLHLACRQSKSSARQTILGNTMPMPAARRPRPALGQVTPSGASSGVASRSGAPRRCSRKRTPAAANSGCRSICSVFIPIADGAGQAHVWKTGRKRPRGG